MSHVPVVPRNLCWPLLGLAVWAGLAGLPYVPVVCVGLAFLVLAQELVLLAALPLLALLAWWGRRGKGV
jgi:hypothetical protein